MVRSILIGFQYSHDRFLPGIIVDLYQIYRYLLRCGHHPGSILVVTDIVQDVRSTTVRNAILDGVVDANILSFVEDLRRSASLVTVSGTSTGTTAQNTLTFCLSEALNQDEKVFVYYTGHGMTLPVRYPGQPLRGGCLMPDYTIWLMDDFLSLLVKCCRSQQTLVCWFDCCGMGEICLPYRLVDSRFRLDQTLEREAKRSTANILIVASTSNDEKSVASSFGSAFTRTLVRLLCHRSEDRYGRGSTDEDKTLPSLIRRTNEAITALKVGHRQTINVVASLPIRPELPTWLLKLEDRRSS